MATLVFGIAVIAGQWSTGFDGRSSGYRVVQPPKPCALSVFGIQPVVVPIAVGPSVGSWLKVLHSCWGSCLQVLLVQGLGSLPSLGAVCAHGGHGGVRVGEANNPGPEPNQPHSRRMATVNVTSLLNS
eukprot:4716829-Alexandrium_andersonii.AAC.1